MIRRFEISQDWLKRFLKVANKVIGSSEKPLRLLYFINSKPKPRFGVTDGCLRFETPIIEVSENIDRSFAIPLDPLIFLVSNATQRIIFELHKDHIIIVHENEILNMKFIERNFPRIPPKPDIILSEKIDFSSLVKTLDSASSICDEDSEIHFFIRPNESFIVGNDGNHVVFSEIRIGDFIDHFLYRLPYVSIRHAVKAFKFMRTKNATFGLYREGLLFGLGNSSMSLCGEIEEEWKKKEFEYFIKNMVFAQGKYIFSVNREIFKKALNRMGKFLKSRNKKTICEFSKNRMRLHSSTNGTRYSITLPVSDTASDERVIFTLSPRKLLNLMERFQSKNVDFFCVGEYVKMIRKTKDIQLFLRKMKELKKEGEL